MRATAAAAAVHSLYLSNDGSLVVNSCNCIGNKGVCRLSSEKLQNTATELMMRTRVE